MNKLFKVTTFALLSLVATGAYSQATTKSPQAVNPEAVKLLRGMTDYLGGLKQFSVVAVNMREDLLESGHRVDFEVTSKMVVSRPNKLKGERLGHLTDQKVYYDGKSLTLYNPTENVYATEAAPGSIEEALDFARENLGLGFPVSDLVYRKAGDLLLQDVTLAVVVGKEIINGVKCDHLLFSKPGVDFQVWIADAGSPLPHKYVVTDTGTPELLSIITLLSGWDVASAVPDAAFTFVAPKEAKAITFLPTTSESIR